MDIKEKIKRLRKTSKITQEQLASYLGVDQTTISKIESDERNLTLDMINKLSDLFLCPVDTLLDDNMDANAISVPFRCNDATGEDLCQVAKANKIILNLKEMLHIKEN